jgi:hypothetical protein
VISFHILCPNARRQPRYWPPSVLSLPCRIYHWQAYSSLPSLHIICWCVIPHGYNQAEFYFLYSLIASLNLFPYLSFIFRCICVCKEITSVTTKYKAGCLNCV